MSKDSLDRPRTVTIREDHTPLFGESYVAECSCGYMGAFVGRWERAREFAVEHSVKTGCRVSLIGAIR